MIKADLIQFYKEREKLLEMFISMVNEKVNQKPKELGKIGQRAMDWEDGYMTALKWVDNILKIINKI